MLTYLSKTSGINGDLKSRPEDFIVEEIGSDGTVFEIDKTVIKPDEEGKFVQFILQKKNWSTSSALSELAKRFGLSQKRFNSAGTKDKLSISTQLASAFSISKEKLLAVQIKDIKITGAWIAKDKVRLGQLLGNRFTLTARNCENNAQEKIAKILPELNRTFPNYFGEQRFGSTRKNTHIIGEKILQGNTEEAVRIFLCDSEGKEAQEALQARKSFADSGDHTAALKYYPKYLRLERSVLAYLERYPGDYTNALRRLPRNILLLFVHAFQSHIFNSLLSERLAGGMPELEKGEYYCGETLGFPDVSKAEAEGWVMGKLIGYDTPLNEREKMMLEKLGIAKEAFRLKSLPEIASKGTYRTLFAPLKDFNFNTDTHIGSDVSALFRFALPAGSYATVAMREFLDSKGE